MRAFPASRLAKGCCLSFVGTSNLVSAVPQPGAKGGAGGGCAKDAVAKRIIRSASTVFTREPSRRMSRLRLRSAFVKRDGEGHGSFMVIRLPLLQVIYNAAISLM